MPAPSHLRRDQDLPRGIRRRSGSYHVNVAWSNQRRTGTAATLDDAIRLRLRLLNELKAGLAKSDPRYQHVWTLKEATLRTTAACWHSIASRIQTRTRAEYALEFFGSDLPLTLLTTDRIDGYILHLRGKGLAPSTVNRFLAALSKVLTYSRRHSTLSGLTQALSIERQRESRGRIRFFTIEEEQQILALCDTWQALDHKDAISVLIDTGMRPSELWRLEARDIQWQQGVLSIWQTKNKQPRSVPMTQRVRSILERRTKTKADQGRPTTKPFDYYNHWLSHFFLFRLKPAMKLTDDAQFIPYALRHTCASRLVQRGINIRVVQEWMGHRDINMTLRYSHLSPTSLLEAMKVLEASTPTLEG